MTRRLAHLLPLSQSMATGARHGQCFAWRHGNRANFLGLCLNSILSRTFVRCGTPNAAHGRSNSPHQSNGFEDRGVIAC